MTQVMRMVQVGEVQGVGVTQRGTDLVCVIRAGFPEDVAQKPELEEWVEVSRERGELVEEKL